MSNNSGKSEIEKLKSRLTKVETEYQYKEQLLIQLEKLSAIGQYIREIIHELKNPLSAISGYTELAKMVPTIEEKMKYIDKIPSNINKITTRLSQFRAMAVNGGSEIQSFNLTENIAQCLSTLEVLKPKGVNINCSFGKNKLPVSGDPQQWLQVFLSIVKMFFEYMNESNPELYIITEYTKSEDILKSLNENLINCYEKQNWKKMLHENSEWGLVKIFNNKFKISKQLLKTALTGKLNSQQNGKMSHLGLVIASDIVKRHGGNIIITFPAKGICIEIFSPVTQ